MTVGDRIRQQREAKGMTPVICFIRNQYKIGTSEASIKIPCAFCGKFLLILPIFLH